MVLLTGHETRSDNLSLNHFSHKISILMNRSGESFIRVLMIFALAFGSRVELSKINGGGVGFMS